MANWTYIVIPTTKNNLILLINALVLILDDLGYSCEIGLAIKILFIS